MGLKQTSLPKTEGDNKEQQQRSSLHTMILRPITRVIARPQRRTFIDWMTNYPDRIMELKKVHQAGGRSVFTWLKQPTDLYTAGVAGVLFVVGVAQSMVGHYRLATGKGKLE